MYKENNIDRFPNEFFRLLSASSKKDDIKSDRYTYDDCDFQAEYVDITFDGKKDIVISLGYEETSGNMVHCAYVNDGGDFVYVKSFEEIPNYSINYEEMSHSQSFHQ